MTGSSRDGDGVSLERNLECVTRDGTILRADVYHPGDGGRYPTLLNRTPYGKLEQRYVDDARTLARRGYTVVVQDQRGRYASDGEYRWMFRDRLETFDAEDGFDAAEWASRLPWSDGQTRHMGPLERVMVGMDAGFRPAACAQGDDGERHLSESAEHELRYLRDRTPPRMDLLDGGRRPAPGRRAIRPLHGRRGDRALEQRRARQVHLVAAARRHPVIRVFDAR